MLKIRKKQQQCRGILPYFLFFTFYQRQTNLMVTPSFIVKVYIQSSVPSLQPSALDFFQNQGMAEGERAASDWRRVGDLARGGQCFQIDCLQSHRENIGMGQCISKNHVKKGASMPSNSARQEKIGITVIKNTESELHFHHSPLPSSAFLNDKFGKPAEPQEVNLTFMLVSVEIDEIKNEVNITFINEKEVNIYFVLGGEEAVSSTNLTINITKVKYVEKINRKERSPKQGERVLVVPTPMNGEPIFVIMQPALESQSMYLINRYTFSPHDKLYKRRSQSLLWTNLAFDLQDIYGSDNLFKCDANEQCSVCLSSPANMILTPCRHMCMCMECSSNIDKISKRCPICRTEFRASIAYK